MRRYEDLIMEKLKGDTPKEKYEYFNRLLSELCIKCGNKYLVDGYGEDDCECEFSNNNKKENKDV